MNQLKLAFIFTIILLPAAMQGQSLNVIHSTSVALDGEINLLRHGDNVFRYTVENGTIRNVFDNSKQFSQVVGTAKITLLDQLLGDKATEYTSASSPAITVWKNQSYYLILDLHTRLDSERYQLKFYFKKL